MDAENAVPMRTRCKGCGNLSNEHINPRVIVMDEPFSALDSVTRKKMQNFVKELFHTAQKSGLNPTFIIVTHDEREAAFLADEVIVLGANPGHVKHRVRLNFDPGDVRKDPKFFEAINYLESII